MVGDDDKGMMTPKGDYEPDEGGDERR